MYQVIIAALLLAVLSGQSTAQETAVETAIERVGPSLVRIHVVMIDYVRTAAS